MVPLCKSYLVSLFYMYIHIINKYLHPQKQTYQFSNCSIDIEFALKADKFNDCIYVNEFRRGIIKTPKYNINKCSIHSLQVSSKAHPY